MPGNTFSFTILHPALDIRQDIACVSFRKKVITNNKVAETDMHFISSNGHVYTTTQDTFKLDSNKVMFEKRLLASDTVNIADLEEWIKNPCIPNVLGLYESVKEILKLYIELPLPSYGLISAWIIGTYFYRAFPSYPYLSFLGPKETGKSNTLECLTNLCFNAIKTRLTTASLGDTADSLRGTIIFDQAHNFGDSLREILVDSYKKGGGKRRIVELTAKGRKIVEFDCYCPKAFASLEPLPDDLADRTFTVNMAPASKSYPSPSASKRDWKQIRTDLVKLLLTSYDVVCDLADKASESEGHRFGELWLPIGVILTLVDADRAEVNEIKGFCERQFSQVKYELSDWDYKLVSCVAEWSHEEITSEDLLTVLRNEIDALEEHKPGKQWLGKAIKRLGLVKEKRGGKHDKTSYILNKEQALKLLGEVGIVGDNEEKDYPVSALASSGDKGKVF